MIQSYFNIFTLIAILLQMVVTSGVAGDRQVYEIRPASQIILNGSSNVNSFTFSSATIVGQGHIDTSAQTMDAGDQIRQAVDAFFKVEVNTFDSGNSRMNRDMYDALKAEEHPYIEFELLSLQFERYISPSEALFSAHGALRVAGVEKSISLQVTVVQLESELYHLQGCKEIQMTDYNVEPPKALLGLVQARDQLTVEFNIYAGQQFSNALAANTSQDDMQIGRYQPNPEPRIDE